LSSGTNDVTNVTTAIAVHHISPDPLPCLREETPAARSLDGECGHEAYHGMARKAIDVLGSTTTKHQRIPQPGACRFRLGVACVAAMVVEEGDGEEVVAAVVSLIGSSSTSSL
jgi:hypothetical protein